MRIAFPVTAFLLFLAISILSGSLTDQGFVLDAESVVQDRQVLEDGDAGDLLGQPWWPDSEDGQGLYRPVTMLYFALVAALGDGVDEAKPFNRGNLFLHFLNGLARFLLVGLLLHGRRFGPLLAVLAALVPAVHAISYESVVGIVGAAELLAGLFMTLSWYVFVLGWSREGPMSGSFFCFLSVFLWFLALLSKETAVFFPLVPILHVLMFRPEERAATSVAVLTLVLAIAAGLGFLGMRSATLGRLGVDPDRSVHAEFSAGDRIASSFAVVGDRYLPEVVWPRRLEPNLTLQDVPPPTSFGDTRVLKGLAVFSALLAWMVMAVRRSRPSALLLFFAFLTYLPASNLLVPIGALGAWRFLYTPLFGVFGALCVEVESAWRRHHWTRFTLTAALGLLLIFGALGTRPLIAMWRSPLTLFETALSFNPRSVWALQNWQKEKFLEGRAAPDVEGLIESAYRFDGIEDELAKLPGRDHCDRATRMISFKILMNLASAYGQRAQMQQNPTRAVNDAHKGARYALRAEDHLRDRPRLAFDARLNAFRLRQLELSLLAKVSNRDPTAEDFLIQDLAGDLRKLNAFDRNELGLDRRMALALAAAEQAELMSDPALAKRHLDDAAHLDPSAPDVASARASHLMRTGKFEEALESLEPAIEAQRAGIGQHMLAIEILRKLGRRDEIRAHERRIIELNPTNPVEDRARRQIMSELGAEERP